MNMLWFLLPLALSLSGFFLWFFLKSVRTGQMDHLDQDSQLPLADDEISTPR